MSMHVRLHRVVKSRSTVKLLLVSLILSACTATSALAATYHVSSAVGNDSNGGLAWTNALKTIAAAVTKANDNDTIYVTNGTYTITSEISLTKAVTLESVNGREVTDIVGNNSFRLLYVNNPNALVSGFTLSKGYSKTGLQGGGFAIGTQGGTVEDCRVTACNGFDASAIYQAGGTVSRCRIDNNTFTTYGQSGTVYLSGGLIENCIIANNQTHRDGAGIWIVGGIARNCTIVGNESSRNGSGVLRSGTGRVENCIIWGNIHRFNPTLASRNFSGATAATVTNCCTPEAIGGNPVTTEPLFVDAANGDYRLQASSPCIDAGSTALNTAATDYSGSTRIIGSAIDIGAFEFDTTSFGCGLRATTTHGLAPLETTFIPTVHGTSTDTNLLELVWHINNGISEPLIVSNTGLQSLTRTLDAGWHTVTLEVTDPVVSKTVMTVVPHAVGVSPETLYVVTENANAAVPYATWETAATNLHAALALAWDGATIVVSNGTYRIPNQLIVDRAVTMRSVNGFDATTIQAPKTMSIRVLMLSHADAQVEGFTLRDGRGGNGNPGGGVLITVDGGTLFNCRVTGNESGKYDASGGGVCQHAGRIANCVIDNNRVTLDSMRGCGIFIVDGIVENCLILTNKTYVMTQTTGGGISMGAAGIVRNCTIVGNTALRGGGIASEGGTIQNCIIVDNVTSESGPGAPNWYIAKNKTPVFQNVCTPASVGENCVTANPEFVDAAANNYQLRLGSPCIDAGMLLEGLPGTDFAGSQRITGAGLDIGAYEYDARVLSCGLLASPEKAVTAADVTLTASFVGFDSEADDLHFTWVLDDVAGSPTQSGLGLSAVQQTFDALGHYNVRLTVSDPLTDKSISTVLTNVVHIAPPTLYLALGNATPVAPYDTWTKAATNVHNVVKEAIDGCTVLISNGTYNVIQPIVLHEAITLRGINGWTKTTLKGNKVEGVHILDLDHADAIVEGLTVRGGRTGTLGSGAGVYLADGTLRHCLLTDNAMGNYSNGGGVYQFGGLISGCIISNNPSGLWSTGGGIAIRNGIIENSLITASGAGTGGGVNISGGIMRNCTVTGNAQIRTGPNTGNGGGVNRNGTGQVVNCIIWGNTSENEGYDGYPDWASAGTTAFSNTCTSVEVGANCIVADPLFKDAAKQDYRLASNSPCRDQGLNQPWMDGAHDLAGDPRILNKLVDIGAYEGHLPGGTLMILR